MFLKHPHSTNQNNLMLDSIVPMQILIYRSYLNINKTLHNKTKRGSKPFFQFSLPLRSPPMQWQWYISWDQIRDIDLLLIFFQNKIPLIDYDYSLVFKCFSFSIRSLFKTTLGRSCGVHNSYVNCEPMYLLPKYQIMKFRQKTIIYARLPRNNILSFMACSSK